MALRPSDVKLMWGNMSDWVDTHMEHNVAWSFDKSSVKITCLDCASVSASISSYSW